MRDTCAEVDLEGVWADIPSGYGVNYTCVSC